MTQRLLIVGAGMACAYLLEALAKASHTLDITVIGEEAQACYNRVLLSNVLAGERDEGDLPMLSATNTQVSFLVNTRIQRIDLERRIAYSDSKDSFAFDKLVFATGSSVALPKIDTGRVTGIEEFRSIADTRHLRALDGTGKHAIVVGGGLLGLEAAHGLNELGFSTSVVHRNKSLMNRQLDDKGSQYLQAALEAKGINFYLGTEIQQLKKSHKQLKGVLLNDSRALPCDRLLFATGILPNIELARDSDIRVDQGILIDDQLQTSAHDVFALGECAQLDKQCFGLVAPIREQATALAHNLLGEKSSGFSIQDWPTQLKISGIDIYRAGELDSKAQQIVLNAPDKGIYRRLVVRRNTLVGAVLVGDKRHSTWYSELIQNKTDIGPLRHSLMFGARNNQQQQGIAA